VYKIAASAAQLSNPILLHAYSWHGLLDKGATRGAKGAEAPPPPLARPKLRKKIKTFNF